jgi:hypothetical protein
MFRITLVYRLLFVKLAFNPTHIANANKKNIYTKFENKHFINTFYGHFTLEYVILSNCLLRLLIVCILCGWDNNDGLDIFRVKLKYPSNLIASIRITFSFKIFSKFKILFFSKRKIKLNENEEFFEIVGNIFVFKMKSSKLINYLTQYYLSLEIYTIKWNFAQSLGLFLSLFIFFFFFCWFHSYFPSLSFCLLW